MKYSINPFRIIFVLALAATVGFSSCNKVIEDLPAPVPDETTGPTLGEILQASAGDSLYYRLVLKSGLLSTLNNMPTAYTMFVPDNSGMKLFINAISGGLVPLNAPDAVFSGFIGANIDEATAKALVSYNTNPQAIPFSSVPATFPNFQYPSIFNPAPTVSALLRLTNFPSSRNGRWLNNIPVTAIDTRASNGIIHHTATIVAPPQRYLWNRIDTDPTLSYLKAAIIRADSGTITTTDTNGTLKSALLNIGANLTVFAPTDAAFRTTLSGAIQIALVPAFTQQLTAAYIAGGVPPAQAAAMATANAPALALDSATSWASTPNVFKNPFLFGALSAQNVQGIVVYHILGTRAFTNNFPTASTLVPTLLNTAIATHPGLGLQATMGAPFVTSASAKGAYNATVSNIIINAAPLTPEPFGTSDQHYLNGVLHKIDQVLLPLPL